MDWTKTPESHRVQFLNNRGQGNGANDSLQLIQVPPSPGSTQLQEPGESGASGGHAVWYETSRIRGNPVCMKDCSEGETWAPHVLNGKVLCGY